MLHFLHKKEEADLKELVAQGAMIIDVRSEDEFAAGHVAGAVNIPLDKLGTESKKITDKKKLIITCCLSGGRSSMAKVLLEKEGFGRVHNGGGWQALQNKLQ